MSRNEEVKQRILKWEQKHDKTMQDLSEREWIQAAEEVLALTSSEAEELLDYLQSKALEVQAEKEMKGTTATKEV